MINTDNNRPVTALSSFLGARKIAVLSHALNNHEDHRCHFVGQGPDKNQGFQTIDSRLLKGAEA